MIDGLGVVGWGVGGIEAEAALLGQPVSMLIPRVLGFKLSGALPVGTTAISAATTSDVFEAFGIRNKSVGLLTINISQAIIHTTPQFHAGKE